MLFNEEFMLLHYPKTAGKSAAIYFCRNFKKDIFGVVSPGQVKEIGLGPADGVHLDVDTSHYNLKKSIEYAEGKGFSSDQFKEILVIARNPYALVVSHYFYMREAVARRPAMLERPSFRLAAESSFSEFCARFNPPQFRNWTTIDAEQIRNVRIISFENLGRDFSTLLEEYNISEVEPLPHVNKAPDDKENYFIDKDSKKNIDQKYHDMFELGGYPKAL